MLAGIINIESDSDLEHLTQNIRKDIIMKLKSIIVALVCTASVVISTVSVNAEERANHVHVWNPAQTEASGFYYADETYHKQTYSTVKYCQDYKTCGGKQIIKTWEEKGTHSWSDADDLGHQGEDHHAFKLKCGTCGGGPTVYIICNYNSTGRHNTPW